MPGLHLLSAPIKGELRGANQAEAIVVVAIVRVVVVPVSNLRVVGVVIPRTATLTAVRTRRRACSLFAEECRFKVTSKNCSF